MKRLFLTLSLIAAVACNQMSLTPVAETESGKIRFLAGGPAVEYNVTTKATVNTSTELITNGFLANAVKGSAGSDVEVWSNQLFTKVGDAWEQDKWWPNADESYRFFGVYPASYTTTFAAGGPTITATNANDILCAYKGDAAYKTVNTLAFEHIFARLSTVTVSMVSPYTISNMSIMLTPKTGGTYNLYTGAGQTDGTGWSSTTIGSAVNIASEAFSAGVSTTNNDIYLVPGTYTLSATWTASKDNYTQTFSNITKDVNLVGGKQNNLTVSFTGNGTEIQFGVSVAEWGTETVDAGEWPLQNYPHSVGVFTINGNGDTVGFAPGNLQASTTNNGTSWTWSFAENQWDYKGDSVANTTINGKGTVSENGTVDLFGWSGLTSKWGIDNSTSVYSYYNSFVDWGTNPDLIATLGSGWRTLTGTSTGEWKYLFDLRTEDRTSTIGSTTEVRYGAGTITGTTAGDINGIILFPDGGLFTTSEFTVVGTFNAASEWTTKVTAAQWADLETKGCVFLPCAGKRNGTDIVIVGISGYYWSSTTYSAGDSYANKVNFASALVNLTNSDYRYVGCSVRLVK